MIAKQTLNARIPFIAVVVALIIVANGLVTLPQSITFGPISLLGLLTISYAGAAWTLWFIHPILIRSAIKTLWPFMLLVVLGFASLLLNSATVSGIQNLIVLIAFLGLVLLCSYESYYSHGFAQIIMKSIVCAAWLATIFYLITLLVGGLGSDMPLEPRPFALVALLGVACHLAAWRYGQRRQLLFAIILILMILASLSRMALFAALVLFPLSQLSFKNLRSWLWMFLITTLLGGGAYLAITYIGPLHDRFFAGDLGFEVGGVAIRTSGRAEVWQVVWSSYLQSPIVGSGVGSAEEAVGQYFGGQIGHPHNDYLRILHDYGVVGLVMLLFGQFKLLQTLIRGWKVAGQRNPTEGSLHLATLLAIVGFSIGMITSNVVIFTCFMIPLGALIGASMGRIGRYARTARIARSATQTGKVKPLASHSGSVSTYNGDTRFKGHDRKS